eukprot:363324-Chlamydomonas_euryale.AAC.20
MLSQFDHLPPDPSRPRCRPVTPHLPCSTHLGVLRQALRACYRCRSDRDTGVLVGDTPLRGSCRGVPLQDVLACRAWRCCNAALLHGTAAAWPHGRVAWLHGCMAQLHGTAAAWPHSCMARTHTCIALCMVHRAWRTPRRVAPGNIPAGPPPAAAAARRGHPHAARGCRGGREKRARGEVAGPRGRLGLGLDCLTACLMAWRPLVRLAPTEQLLPGQVRARAEVVLSAALGC